MFTRIRKLAILFLGLTLIVSTIVGEASGQTRKKKKRRTAKPAAAPVITNPTIAPATTAENAQSDVKVISTADQANGDSETTSDLAQPKKAKSSPPNSDEDMQKTINSLSNQVNRLNDRLSKMQDDDRYLMDMERLTRAEQRSEQLRSQMIDTQTKMADLQSRMDQIDYMLKPENIDRASQLVGTVHPEDIRDARRKQLEGEKTRVQAQLDLLEKSRARLESAISTADAEVDMLHARLNQQRDQQDNSSSQETKPRKPNP